MPLPPRDATTMNALRSASSANLVPKQLMGLLDLIDQAEPQLDLDRDVAYLDVNAALARAVIKWVNALADGHLKIELRGAKHNVTVQVSVDAP